MSYTIQYALDTHHSPPVVGGRDGVESLLASCVPKGSILRYPMSKYAFPIDGNMSLSPIQAAS